MKGRRYTDVAAASPGEKLVGVTCSGRWDVCDLPPSPSPSGDYSERLAGHTAHPKDGTKEKVMPRVECASGVVHHGVGSTVLCSGGLKGESAGLTAAKDTMLNILVQVRCAERGNGATPYLAHLSRVVTLEKSGVKALRVIHLFCTWWKLFILGAALRRNLRDQHFN